MTTQDMIEPTETTQDEPIVLPLPDAVTNVSNTFFRLQKAQATLAEARYAMIQAIKNNPELAALQETIDIAENHAKTLESEYSLAKMQVKESTLANWQDGMDKTMYGGLLQVAVKSNSVLHWDASKALSFALSVPPQYQFSLLTADKQGFVELAKKGREIAIPEEILQIGDLPYAKLIESELINHVDMSIYEHGQEESLPDDTTDIMSDSDKAHRDVYNAPTPF